MLVSRSITILDAGRTLSAVGMKKIPLTVKSQNRIQNKIVLSGILHVSRLFTNLVSETQLFQQGFHLYFDVKMVNSLFDNNKIASAPI